MQNDRTRTQSNYDLKAPTGPSDGSDSARKLCSTPLAPRKRAAALHPSFPSGLDDEDDNYASSASRNDPRSYSALPARMRQQHQSTQQLRQRQQQQQQQDAAALDMLDYRHRLEEQLVWSDEGHEYVNLNVELGMEFFVRRSARANLLSRRLENFLRSHAERSAADSFGVADAGDAASSSPMNLQIMDMDDEALRDVTERAIASASSELEGDEAAEEERQLRRSNRERADAIDTEMLRLAIASAISSPHLSAVRRGMSGAASGGGSGLMGNATGSGRSTGAVTPMSLGAAAGTRTPAIVTSTTSGSSSLANSILLGQAQSPAVTAPGSTSGSGSNGRGGPGSNSGSSAPASAAASNAASASASRVVSPPPSRPNGRISYSQMLASNSTGGGSSGSSSKGSSVNKGKGKEISSTPATAPMNGSSRPVTPLPTFSVNSGANTPARMSNGANSPSLGPVASSSRLGKSPLGMSSSSDVDSKSAAAAAAAAAGSSTTADGSTSQLAVQEEAEHERDERERMGRLYGTGTHTPLPSALATPGGSNFTAGRSASKSKRANGKSKLSATSSSATNGTTSAAKTRSTTVAPSAAKTPIAGMALQRVNTPRARFIASVVRAERMSEQVALSLGIPLPASNPGSGANTPLSRSRSGIASPVEWNDDEDARNYGADEWQQGDRFGRGSHRVVDPELANALAKLHSRPRAEGADDSGADGTVEQGADNTAAAEPSSAGQPAAQTENGTALPEDPSQRHAAATLERVSQPMLWYWVR